MILLVLVLNLVCLALLVIRSFQEPVPRTESAAAPQAVAPVAEVEAAAPEPSRPVAPRPPPARPAAARLVSEPSPAAAKTDPVPSPQEQVVQVVTPPAPLVNLGDTRTGQRPAQGVTVPDHRRDLPELSGFVTLRGTPPPEIPIAFSPACGALHPPVFTTRHYVVNQEGGLANALVWLLDAKPAPALVEPPLLDQVGCMFEPYVMAVVAGQRFQVRNSDPVLHNLHFTPKLNRERNIAQARKGQIDSFVLPQPELFVRIKCDVHPWMFAYVSALDHPYFCVTDTNGFFQIPAGFAPGRYRVSADHLKTAPQVQEVELRGGERQSLHFELSVREGAQASNR
jgi:hypothetical protein